MGRIRSFEGKQISIDGVVGILVGPHTELGQETIFRDSHYRFLKKVVDELVVEIVVSGRALRTAPDDSPHGHRSFVLSQQPHPIVGSTTFYNPKTEEVPRLYKTLLYEAGL